MHQTRGQLYPAPVDHVSGERVTPAGDAQLLQQLSHLLLRQSSVQVGSDETLFYFVIL